MGSWVARIRGRISWRAFAAALVVLFGLVGAGVGGYMIGSPPGIDFDAVRAEAAAEGREKGLKEGARQAYARGYRSARKRPHPAAYTSAYKAAYTREFTSAGLNPPERIRVPDPR